jgi:soluble lytic murein transglycosylase-like protein
MISYVVDPSGLVLVSTVDRNVAFGPPLLPSGRRGAFRDMVSRWQPLVDQVGTDFRLPSSLLFGIMWAESNGNPNAQHRNANGTIDAGIMQINQVNWRGNTLAAMLVPETNMKIAGEILRAAQAGFRDLPQVASEYNAGHKPDGSPYTNADRPAIATRWGYAAGPGYIDTVVAASNTFLQDFALGKVS